MKKATKTCVTCGVPKPADIQHFNKKLDGLQSRCRECRCVERSQAFKALPTDAKEALNQRRRLARADNAEAFRAAERARYAASDTKKQTVYAYRQRNPERVKATHRRYYEANKQRIIARVLAYDSKNVERKKERMNTWTLRRRLADPAFRLSKAVTAHVYLCLRKGKAGQKWESLVGYTLSDLMLHLEKQFVEGMCWSNYGQWHIDHIVPVASFRFESHVDGEFRRCWALTNLRPLWAAENRRKSDSRAYLV